MSSSRRPAVVLIGHGSRTRGFDSPLRRVASALRREKKYSMVSCSFLSAAEPSIPKAIDRCVERGARQVLVLPYFVLNGKHVTRDIPSIVREAARRHRGRCRISLRPYLGYHPLLVSVVKARLSHG